MGTLKDIALAAAGFGAGYYIRGQKEVEIKEADCPADALKLIRTIIEHNPRLTVSDLVETYASARNVYRDNAFCRELESVADHYKEY